MEEELKAAYKIGKMRSSMWVNPVLAAVNFVFGMTTTGIMRVANFAACGFLLIATYYSYRAMKALLEYYDLDEDELSAK
jgi:hypothetical protein